MAQQPYRTPTRTRAATAAALFCLAGAAAGMAQTAEPGPGDGQQGSNAFMNLFSGLAGFGPNAQPAAEPPAEPSMRNPLEQEDESAARVKVDDNLIVDLHVNAEDLANVLQMLSIQSQRNIISSKNVSATVTANLYGVTFHEALDAILHVNGFGYIERGNFIYVYTLDELKVIQESMRPMIWRVIRLNYLNSTDAAEFVKPLLSERGQIKTNGPTGAFSIPETGPVGGEDFANEATMLLYDFEENVEEIESVLAGLDTRPAQVLIQATVLQTAINEANAFGVDFSIIGNLNFADFAGIGGPLKAADNLITGDAGAAGDGVRSGTVSSPGNTGGPSTFKAGIIAGDLAAFVRMLDEVSDTTIISRPNILTLNRQPARVLVGRKVGYLNTTSTDTATTQTVQFLDTGTQLYVRPFVTADGLIRMELKPKVSEAIIRSAVDATGAAVTVPDELSNELTTNVIVRDGQTIVLGGLFRESTQTSRRQVPLIGDIPLIGAAFRGHDDTIQRNEVIFMITPSIVNDEVLVDQGRRGEAAVERVRTGSRAGLLPFSREKRTGQLLVEAERRAAEGDFDGALHKVQRALALSPNQPDALSLRERLMGKKKVWPERNLMTEIINGELERRHEGYTRREPEPQRPAADASLAALERSDNAPGIPASGPQTSPQPEPEMTPDLVQAEALALADDSAAIGGEAERPSFDDAAEIADASADADTAAADAADTADDAAGFAEAPEVWPEFADGWPEFADVPPEFADWPAGGEADALEPEFFDDPDPAHMLDGPEEGEEFSFVGDDWPAHDGAMDGEFSEPSDFADGFAEEAVIDDPAWTALGADQSVNLVVPGEFDFNEPEGPHAFADGQDADDGFQPGDDDFEPFEPQVNIYGRDLDLPSVLNSIASCCRRHVVMSRHVRGKITANLRGVTFYEALDTLLASDNFGFSERGGIVYIFRKGEPRPVGDEAVAVGERTITLKSLDPTLAADSIKPLLSKKGSARILASETAGSIRVRDFPLNMDEVEWLLAKLDDPNSAGITGAVPGAVKDDPMIDAAGLTARFARTQQAISDPSLTGVQDDPD